MFNKRKEFPFWYAVLSLPTNYHYITAPPSGASRSLALGLAVTPSCFPVQRWRMMRISSAFLCKSISELLKISLCSSQNCEVQRYACWFSLTCSRDPLGGFPNSLGVGGSNFHFSDFLGIETGTAEPCQPKKHYLVSRYSGTPSSLFYGGSPNTTVFHKCLGVDPPPLTSHSGMV